MRIARGLAVLIVLVFSATSAMAGGFRLPEAGAKAMGMGFAFTAQADDPSAIYFNPAGIVQLEGSNFKGGITYVKENGGTFTGTTPLTGGATVTETQKDLISTSRTCFSRGRLPRTSPTASAFSRRSAWARSTRTATRASSGTRSPRST